MVMTPEERTVDLMLKGLSSCCEAPLDTSKVINSDQLKNHGTLFWVINSGQFKNHGPRFCSKCKRLCFVV